MGSACSVFFTPHSSADRPTALNCVQPLSCHRKKQTAQFGVESQLADLPAVYTSSLPYLTQLCEDFLLLEKESKLYSCYLSETTLEATK